MHNIIQWLIPLLGKTDRLSDYTLGKLFSTQNWFRVGLDLEYGVALLMNLCLRTNGRKKCAEIADQSITVLSGLLTHPNQEVSDRYKSTGTFSLCLDSTVCKFLAVFNFDLEIRA